MVEKLCKHGHGWDELGYVVSCRRHAPVVVNDSRRVTGEDYKTVFPDAKCPCGDFEDRENGKEKERR